MNDFFINLFTCLVIVMLSVMGTYQFMVGNHVLAIIDFVLAAINILALAINNSINR